MDVTYIDSMVGKIEGNVFIGVDVVDDLIRVMREHISENTARQMIMSDGQRFYYDATQKDIDKKIKKALPSNVSKQFQQQVNQQARVVSNSEVRAMRKAGATTAEITDYVQRQVESANARGEIEINTGNAWVDQAFAPTGEPYRRGGHLYVGGTRIY